MSFIYSYYRLAFRCLVRKYDCDVCFTPMIVAADFMRSVKARDSEFTTKRGNASIVCFICELYVIVIDTDDRVADSKYLYFDPTADQPLIVQFAAKDAQTLADAACVVAPFSDGVDVNCGCPQR